MARTEAGTAGRTGLSLTIIAAGLSVCAASVAQQTLADLQAMNAHRLTSAELTSLLNDTKLEFTSPRNILYQYDSRSDGSLSGYAATGAHTGNAFSPGRGTWRVGDGQYCIDSTWGRSQPFDVKWCADVFQTPDSYFLLYPGRSERLPVRLVVKKL